MKYVVWAFAVCTPTATTTSQARVCGCTSLPTKKSGTNLPESDFTNLANPKSGDVGVVALTIIYSDSKVLQIRSLSSARLQFMD